MDAIRRRYRASAEAADWWALLQSDELSRADREQFVEWLCESPLHVTEMLRLMQVQAALAQFDEWETLPKEEPGHESTVVPISQALLSGAQARNEPHAGRPEAGMKRSRRGLWLSSLAASVVALLCAGLLLLPTIRGQVIATDRGERREIVLEDGSVVQVGPQTRLRVRYEEQARNVWLTRGRAVFRVAKSPDRPFLVRTEGAMVRAVGTAFGVERRNGEVVVTVVEGRVAVSSPAVTASAVREQATGNAVAVQTPAEILLSANQQITMRRGASEARVQTVESQEELAWAEGRLIFRDDTVAHVISEFNRYSRMQLEVTDPGLAARRVSGVFDAALPEEFIAFLQTTMPVKIERIDGRVVRISTLAAPSD